MFKWFFIFSAELKDRKSSMWRNTNVDKDKHERHHIGSGIHIIVEKHILNIHYFNFSFFFFFLLYGATALVLAGDPLNLLGQGQWLKSIGILLLLLFLSFSCNGRFAAITERVFVLTTGKNICLQLFLCDTWTALGNISSVASKILEQSRLSGDQHNLLQN